MLDNIRQIAMRIQELREAAGDAPNEIAAALNVPIDKYNSYETGTSDIPISFLCEFAAYYHVDVTELLTGERPKLSIYSLVRRGEGVAVERLKQYKYESLAENFSKKRTQPFMVTAEPNVENTPIHLNSHSGQEFDYVVEGKLCININGREMILEEGDCIYFDSSYPHGMKAVGNVPARFIAVVIP